MISSQGQDINQKLFDHFYKIEQKRINSKLPERYAKTVYNSLPDTEILSPESAIKYVKQNSPLDNDEIIVKGINTFLDNKQLVRSTKENYGLEKIILKVLFIENLKMNKIRFKLFNLFIFFNIYFE